VLHAFGITDQGHFRPTNQDCFVIDHQRRLCVVADGMGGHNAGEVAARLAVDAIVGHVRGAVGSASWPFGYDKSLSTAGNRLRTAIHLANSSILEFALTARGCTGMGTTIVAMLLEGSTLSVAHVGDSRLYVFAGNELRQLTHDDSWMATVMASHPDADPTRFRYHPMRNVLTNVVGCRATTDVHVVEERLKGGELLVLTTDGVHGVLDEQRMGRMLGQGGAPPQLAADLVRAALARGSSDNCTAIVGRYLAD
jgi:protein phosphatase